MSEPIDKALAYRVFAAVLEAEPCDREALLAGRCAGSPALERRVRSLLALADSGAATGFVVASPAPALPERIGREYGRFRLLELLGVGGMGAVYRAERIDGVPQTVAIKVLRDGISAAHSTQFAREARLLAGLEHPSIARLIDVGVREGEGWIAMEFVAGRPITEYSDAVGLDLPARARLLVAVADAIITAHRRLVVHRDIKPSNVLVGEDGRPRLIDFGIAYALQDASAGREATADVSRLFTPHYAAPEQVRGEPVTVATDVFGLGALAYRLLAGREPYAEATSAVGYLMAVTQRDIRMPSEAARATGLGAAQVRALKGDLDSILMKALERDPARRYAGVEGLRADLLAWLEGRPVAARAATPGYRLAKFARRHAWALGLGGLALAGLLVAGAVFLAQERRVAQALLASARRGAFLESMLKSADPRGSGNRDVTVAQLLDGTDKDIGELAASEPLVAASMLALVAETDLSLGRIKQGLEANGRELDLLRAQRAPALELAQALTTRGDLLINDSRNEEAEVPLREALGLLDHRRGTDLPLASALEQLAKATQNQGKEAEAEALYLREIEVDKRAGAAAVGGRAGLPLGGLGTIRYYQGRYAESTALLARSLEIERKYFPPDNTDLLDAQYNYAVALDTNHEAAKAEPLFRSLLASYRRILGPQHSDTYGAQQGLAHDLMSQKKYQAAADEALAAATGLAATLGDASSWTDTAWGIYGLSSCLAGHADAGIAALRRVVALRTHRSSADDWTTQSTNVQLGTCLVSLHRYAEAEPLLLRAAAILERSRSARQERTQAAYRALRDLYAGSGRGDEAARWQAKLVPGGD